MIDLALGIDPTEDMEELQTIAALLAHEIQQKGYQAL
jgi:hypothetical protein